jgi:hypothetical protein
MTTNEFLAESYKANRHWLMQRANDFDQSINETHFIRPRAVCKDGFTISIQASFAHYSNPRLTIPGHYKEVELGYPTEAEPLLADYAEDSDDLTHTVYGFVPVELVDKVLAKHGGIVDDQELMER